jgi:hypothetical protein
MTDKTTITPERLNGIMQAPTQNERDLVREVERLRAAWLRVIQAENSCQVSGRPCDGKRCGCAAEQEMLIREAEEA